MKKITFILVFILLSSCSFKFKEENKLLIPEYFQEEYKNINK